MSYPMNPNDSGYPPPYSASQGSAGYNYPPMSGYPPGSGYPPYSQPPAVGFQQPGMVSGPGYPPPPQGYPPPASAGYAPPQGYPQPQGYSYGGGDGSGYPPPISSQPTAMGQAAPPAQDGWMSIPQGIPMNCPPGLEYLTSIDQLLVHQKVELLEALIGFESNNKFTIKNSVGQKVFYAVEDTDCCTRNCCGPWRPFDMKILDNYKNQVIHLNRPLACDSCWFPCCLQSIEVFAPPGCLVGTVQQEWSILTPEFSIKNAAGDTILRIEGPVCTFSMCGDVEFKVLSKDSSQVVGKISKQWTGLLREAFTDADYFGITFPVDLDVRMKAVMLGACFLIDAMFFEKSGNRETDRPGMF